ncbi:MAG: CCA tRNA nucleotidyltransferase [Chloroflexi bacterium]|nr:CCA tRNA nucleotidyltransferase [Chloroflexota bacterium]
MTNLTEKLKSEVNAPLSEILLIAGDSARENGFSIYLVGGIVRDILLGRPYTDLDLVVEGDAILLAQDLTKKTGGQAIIHDQFGTAKFTLHNQSIDLVTARSETYSKPGALPEIVLGNLNSDLMRRDFTINAIAISLNTSNSGEVIDPYDGIADIRNGIIRILHHNSFIDDATRIFRAIRYEQRLNFKLEQETEKLLHRDIKMIKTISGDRVRHEFELIFKEQSPEHIISRSEELGVLAEINPHMKANSWLADKFNEARNFLKPADSTAYFAMLSYNLNKSECEIFISRLGISSRAAQVIRDVHSLKKYFDVLSSKDLSSSNIYHILEFYSLESIQISILAQDLPLIKQRLELFLKELRNVKTSLDGEVLKEMGVPEGLKLGQMLRKLKDARLDGLVKTPEEEIIFIKKLIA